MHRRKLVIASAIIFFVCVLLYFFYQKDPAAVPAPGLKITDGKIYNLEDNEKRNAEFLKVMRERQQAKAQGKELPAAETPPEVVEKVEETGALKEAPTTRIAATPTPKPLKIAEQKQIVKKSQPPTTSAKKAETPFKSGFYRPTKDCNIMQRPDIKAKKVGLLSKGKKAWVDAHDLKWVKIHLKSGPGYVARNCF